ncbi:CHASE4 domain-containing protein [Zavarzinia sp. CC-PAN008]|uniref:CHASE4 domain-containing protein n=1 Tax=Zavarzinia sp. CC-PAN008 TaxID=3243332 RepID=UPI003F743DAC
MIGAHWTTSLNNRILRVVAIAIAILLVGNAALFALIVWPTFTDLELTAARRNTDRILDAIAKEQVEFSRPARDISAWDPTYEFVGNQTEDYIRQTFTYEVLNDLNFNLLGIYDTAGNVVRTTAFALEDGNRLAIPPFDGPLPADSPLLRKSTTDELLGIIMSSHGPMLLASFPVLQSTREGPVKGTFFAGRFLGPALIRQLEDQTHVRFNIYRTDDGSLPAHLGDIAGRLNAGEEYISLEASMNEMVTYHLLPMLFDAKPLVLEVRLPREIAAIGRSTVAIAAASMLVTCLLVMAVIWLLLKREIVGPIKNLTRHVEEVGRTGDLTRRLDLPARPRLSDEITTLARGFDDTNAQLYAARQRLLEQSYHDGMAEIAAGVIHNVRNALSPVAVSLWRLSDEAVAKPSTFVGTALTELRESGTSPERRETLVDFVEESFNVIVAKSRGWAQDLRLIADQNRHIERVLDDHAALSTGSRRLMPVSVAEQVRDLAGFVPRDSALDISVKVANDLASLPPVLAHPVVMSQLLGNIMVNAIDAIRESGSGSGTIELKGELIVEQDRTMVHLIVTDTGIGFDPDLAPQLFERGFSTKKGKSGGLGLHWCANSLIALAGRMWVESPGRGQGCSVHVVIPAVNHNGALAA